MNNKSHFKFSFFLIIIFSDYLCFSSLYWQNRWFLLFWPKATLCLWTSIIHSSYSLDSRFSDLKTLDMTQKGRQTSLHATAVVKIQKHPCLSLTLQERRREREVFRNLPEDRKTCSSTAPSLLTPHRANRKNMSCGRKGVIIRESCFQRARRRRKRRRRGGNKEKRGGRMGWEGIRMDEGRA